MLSWDTKSVWWLMEDQEGPASLETGWRISFSHTGLAFQSIQQKVEIIKIHFSDICILYRLRPAVSCLLQCLILSRSKYRSNDCHPGHVQPSQPRWVKKKIPFRGCRWDSGFQSLLNIPIKTQILERRHSSAVTFMGQYLNVPRAKHTKKMYNIRPQNVNVHCSSELLTSGSSLITHKIHTW